jgi:hypothetical protein
MATETTVPTTHKRLVEWVDQAVKLCEPEDVHWCDGTAEEYDRLCAALVELAQFAVGLRGGRFEVTEGMDLELSGALLESVVGGAQRFLPNRHLPDKALGTLRVVGEKVGQPLAELQ